MICFFQNCGQPFDSQAPLGSIALQSTNPTPTPVPGTTPTPPAATPTPPVLPTPTPIAANRFKQLSAGGDHACAITGADTVVCWGSNQYSQVGNGSTNNSLVPVPVAGLGAVKQISAGDYHTCAVNAQDLVFCWGHNRSGQLGNNSTTNSGVPVAVVGLHGVRQVEAGSDHTCALTLQNTVMCWGGNAKGQLGNNAAVGTIDPVTTPVAVVGLQGIKQISTGWYSSCAITAQDTVVCWGYNVFGQLGNNVIGQLLTPNEFSAGPVAVVGLQGAKQISAKGYHACALKNQNNGSCWGYNDYGQLANNSLVTSAVPISIANQSLKQTSTYGYRTCLLTAQDSVVCHGLNVATLATGIASLQGIKQVSTGGRQICAITAQDTIVCLGPNERGQLGNNTTTTSVIPVAVLYN